MANAEPKQASEADAAGTRESIVDRMPQPPYRVLAMDGGGIYGVFTAIMLRKLCERQPKFLTNDQITLFAGTSAGALNALLLAKHENPREAIENRTLENFFKDARLYSNRLDPVAGALSLVGLTSWSGKADFYSILEDHFGDMKMKDLKHPVLITAFDLWGKRDQASTEQQRWKPKIFYNFPEGEVDRELYVKDVAYGAASPPTLRPIVNGITDGGFYADDPSVNAIAKLIMTMRDYKEPLVMTYRSICKRFMDEQAEQGPFANLLGPGEPTKVAASLSDLKAQALGPDNTRAANLQQLAQELDKKQNDLLSGNYLKIVSELTSTFAPIVEVLQLEAVMAHLSEGIEYLPPAPAKKLNEQDWDKIKAFVGSVVALLGWELEFWRLLWDIVESTSLPDAVKKEQIGRPREVVALLKLVHDAASTFFEKADYRIEDLVLILVRIGLLRKKLYEELAPDSAAKALKYISILSVGVGAKTPHYLFRDFDFGVVPFNLMPTNLRHKFFQSPLLSFVMNPDKQQTTYEAKRLLGENDYFRLDPPAVGFPVPSVMTACFLAKFYLWRQYILGQIYQITESQNVGEQIGLAQKWIQDHVWV